MTADTPRYAQIFDTLSKRVQTGFSDRHAAAD